MTHPTNKTVVLFTFCGFLFIAFHSVGFAEKPSPEDTGLDNVSDLGGGLEGFHFFGNLITVIVVLLIIIFLIVFTIKFLALKNKSWMANRSVRTLGGLPLGQNKSLQVIEVGHSVYLVGVGDQVQLIDKIDNPEEIEYIIESLSSVQSMPGARWLPFLTKWLKGMYYPRQLREEDEAASSFQEVFRTKINSMSNRKQIVEQLMQEQKIIDRSND